MLMSCLLMQVCLPTHQSIRIDAFFQHMNSCFKWGRYEEAETSLSLSFLSLIISGTISNSKYQHVPVFRNIRTKLEKTSSE
mmetsp:Transcript_4239/g.6356  ORF Transcript_4239/g.6356 Transcript_4239/m.6356 type:complete len:81 (-) Transcript_4239:173-415(-)